MARKPRHNKAGEPLQPIGAWVPEVWLEYADVVSKREQLPGQRAGVVVEALRRLFVEHGLLGDAEPGKQMRREYPARKGDRLDIAA